MVDDPRERRAENPVGGGVTDRAEDRERFRPDLEGVRATIEDVGSLPVPRSVIEQREGRARPRPVRPPPPVRPEGPSGRTLTREEEARIRRTVPHAARTPEELGRALSRAGQEGIRDPQRGHEAGPPLPGEPGVHGDGKP